MSGEARPRFPPRTPGFDCSGLVQWAYGQAGIALPRTAQQQHDAVTPVAAAQAQPGDLVFWNDGTTSVQHVAIYVGAGIVLEAPSTGSVVSYCAPVARWPRRFRRAHRPRRAHPESSRACRRPVRRAIAA